MREIGASIGAIVVWGGVFVLLTVAINGYRTRRPLDTHGLLVAFPLFCAFQVVLAKALDFAGGLNRVGMSIAYGLVLAALAGAVVVLRDRFPRRADGRRSGAVRWTLRWIAFALAALFLLGFATPPAIWDVVMYHLPMVANYVQNESLGSWATQCLRQIHRGNVAELIYLNLALLARSDVPLDAANWLATLVGLTAVFRIGSKLLLGDRLALIPVVLIFTAPQLVLAPMLLKNDALFFAGVLCSFYWALSVVESDRGIPWKRIGLLAVSLGLVVGTKVPGVCVAAAVGLVLLYYGLRRRVPPAVPFVAGLATAAAIAVLVGDVMWRAYVETSLPMGFVPGEDTYEKFIVGPGAILPAIDFYVGELCFRRLLLPQVKGYGQLHYGYLFPLVFAAGSIAGARTLWRGRKGEGSKAGALALLAFGTFVAVIAFRKPVIFDQRFMTWMVPTFGILAVEGRQRFLAGRSRAILVFCVAFMLNALVYSVTTTTQGRLALTSLRSTVAHGRVPRLAALGATDPWLKGREDLNRGFKGYDVLDRMARPDDRILLLGHSESAMYGAWGRRFSRTVHGVRDADDARRKLESGGYRFVIVETEVGDRLKQWRVDPQIRRTAEEFIERTPHEVVHESNVRRIYRFDRAARSGAGIGHPLPQ